MGFNWLQKHNPNVDWKMGDVTFDHCPLECAMPSVGVCKGNLSATVESHTVLAEGKSEDI